MATRDDYYKPALSDRDAMAMAQEQWDAVLRRSDVSQSVLDSGRVIVRELADAYIASNSSTMRACRALSALQSE